LRRTNGVLIQVVVKLVELLVQRVPEAHLGFARQNGGASMLNAHSVSGNRKSSKDRAKVFGALHMNQGVDMNSSLIRTAGAVCLFAVGGIVYAQSAPQTAPPPTQPSIQKAQAPAQASADTSYGGVPATGSAAAGSMAPPTCVLRTSCDVFHGH
jgi:hypothetical protein